MPEIVKTHLDRIKTFPIPPANFDPKRATAAELQSFGAPARPDPARQPQFAATWDRVFSKKLSYVKPEFVHLEDIFPGVHPSPPGSMTGTADDIQPNWSGSAYLSKNDPFSTVVGSWTVADVQPPAGAGAGCWAEVTWVGIWGAGQIIQVGSVTGVSQTVAGKPQKGSTYAWWEWCPAGWTGITTFEVSTGDVLTCVLCHKSPNPDLPEYAEFKLVNVTTGKATGFTYPAPAGLGPFQAENAGWIVERPTAGGLLALPDYGWIYFDECTASTVGGQSFNPEQGTLIEMEESGQIVSVPTIETPTLMKLTYGPNAQ